ncbi:DUF4386 domain-containing protein [Streptomyces sp. NBC_01239]|uniref:hypothetical protein n=1 Tax=Streptomyces sp. NBC_01239 TaxID=2903792 RepID=UPI002250B3ED|nr:hypothetical protein [Streptomyces sp. NBC_01239]MCX4815206.1 DUF4386 domain-containing protein [Streptomyces sp. NBC_01239]
MDEKLKFRLYRFSVWCGLAVMVANTVAFSVLGHLTPPPSPSDSPQQIAAFLVEHRTGILWAVVLMGLVVPLFYPFAVITSLQMRRIEGGWGLLSMVQLTTGVVAPTGWLYPLAVLATAAYRPDRDPKLMQLLSDQFWLTYVGVAVIFTVNVWSIGVAALVDRREKKIFPRWFGWLNIVLGLVFLPGVFCYAVTSGPFAWNGFFPLYVPSIAFIVWKISMLVILMRAVKSEERETLVKPATVPAAV